MDELTVLSPHRDDAAFSLCQSLARWTHLPLKLRVVNFFTVSAYGPRSGSTDRALISSLRKREDERAIASIDREIKIESLDLLDAPLRLGVNVSSVCRSEMGALQPQGEAENLAYWIRRYLRRGLVLSPLGLGNHVDHLAVKTAAVSSSMRNRLGFYEDLPYAIWTPDSVLRRSIGDIEERTGMPLRPVVIRGKKGVRWKARIIGGYASQITREHATGIAQFALTYRGCERIWIPKHAKGWQLLIT
ncbi:MAG: PIG-L family deacetylase [Bryobacteraceae bacterium]